MFFFWISCCRWLLLFSWKFLATFMLCDCYFLPQCNLILNFFLLTSSGDCPNHTIQRLIPQGTHGQVCQARLAKMHLLSKSSIWHCSFQISSHLLIEKDTSSFRHYLLFLLNFYDFIITIPPPFTSWQWAPWMICNSLQFILFASYHCLLHREF